MHRIYVKSRLFEPVQMNRKLLKEPLAPIINTQVFIDSKGQDDNNYESVLTLQLMAKENGSLLWRLQLQQARLYFIKGYCMSVICACRRDHLQHGDKGRVSTYFFSTHSNNL